MKETVLKFIFAFELGKNAIFLAIFDIDRMLAAKHGVAERKYFDSLIERRGKCFVCAEPASNEVFCDAHSDDV